MRIGLGGELASTAAALATAAVLFPFMRQTPGSEIPRDGTVEPSAAFVTLSADEEAAAVRAARSSWKTLTGGERIRLSCDELPETREPEAVGDSGRTRMGRPADIGWRPPPLPPGLAAPQPVDEEPETAAPLPFPREDMLQLP